MTTTFVKGPAGMLEIDNGGTGGLPVVFVPSFAGDTTYWEPQLAHLRGSRQAVAVALRGRGRSLPPSNGDYHLTSQAQDIAAAVDGLGLDKFVLVAHSMGGCIALLYAAQHPERLAGLLLVDTNGDPHAVPEDLKRQYLAGLESSYNEVLGGYTAQLLQSSAPAVREKVLRETMAFPKGPSIAMLKEVFEFDPRQPIARYSGPKLHVVTAANDAPTSLQHIVPGLPYAVVQGTGHWLHLDKPEEFNALLDGFLEKVDTAQGARR